MVLQNDVVDGQRVVSFAGLIYLEVYKAKGIGGSRGSNIDILTDVKPVRYSVYQETENPSS